MRNLDMRSLNHGVFIRRIKANPLIKSLLELEGNSRSCVYTEPLWGIPYNLYGPFVTVFMFSLGLSDVDIGTVLSVGTFLQLFTSFLGGVLTDKIGRRYTTFIFDLMAWGIPCLIWCFAQNFWWFMAAAIINSLWQVTNVSWTCLMVEDVESNKLIHIFNWVTICGLLAVFFAPLSGIFIKQYSLVFVMRVLYFISFIFMTAKFIVLFIFSTETKRGKIRMEETKNISILKMLAGYKDVTINIFKTPETFRILMLSLLINVSMLVRNNFFSLYATQDLLAPDDYLAYFPILRAVIMLVFLFSIQRLLEHIPIKVPMLVGLVIYVVNHVLLVVCPPGNMPVLFFSVLLEAFAYALFMPRKDSLTVQHIDPKERARILSAISAVMLGISSPFGVLVGMLSSMDRRLPFVLNCFLYAVMAVIVLKFNNIEKTKNDLQHA